MKPGDFSNEDPIAAIDEAVAAGIAGLYIKQGVPLLDRDLNMLGGLPLSLLRTLSRDFIGNGVPEGSDAFAVTPAPDNLQNDVYVQAGTYLVDGLQITLADRTLYSELAQQGRADAMPTPPNAGTRTDLLYIDVRTTPETLHLTEPDIGEATSMRAKTRWRLRVAEGKTWSTLEPAPHGSVYVPLAELERWAGEGKIEVGQGIDTRIEIARPGSVAAALLELKSELKRLEEKMASFPRYETKTFERLGATPQVWPLLLDDGPARQIVVHGTAYSSTLGMRPFFGMATPNSQSGDVHDEGGGFSTSADSLLTVRHSNFDDKHVSAKLSVVWKEDVVEIVWEALTDPIRSYDCRASAWVF